MVISKTFATQRVGRCLHSKRSLKRGRMMDDEWILTSTGKRFFPLNPKIADIDIRDIAYGLAGEQRFSSQCYPRYTVAQHSYIVSCHVSEKNALAALLHDASEGL